MSTVDEETPPPTPTATPAALNAPSSSPIASKKHRDDEIPCVCQTNSRRRWRQWRKGVTLHNVVSFTNPSQSHRAIDEQSLDQWQATLGEELNREIQIIWLWDIINGRRCRTAFDAEEVWDYYVACAPGDRIKWAWGKGLKGVKVRLRDVRAVGRLAGRRASEIRRQIVKKREQKRQRQAEEEDVNLMAAVRLFTEELAGLAQYSGEGEDENEYDDDDDNDNQHASLWGWPQADLFYDELTDAIHVFPTTGSTLPSFVIPWHGSEELSSWPSLSSPSSSLIDERGNLNSMIPSFPSSPPSSSSS